MPSIKKRVTGFIRQLSAPNGAAPAQMPLTNGAKGGGGHTKAPKLLQQQPPQGSSSSSSDSEGFIQKYLNG